jgi:4-alpha-glucanotransferase
MYINFFVKYGTNHGENIDVTYKQHSSEESKTFHLNYYDKNLWHGSLFIDEKSANAIFEYEILLKKGEWQHSYTLMANAILNLANHKTKSFDIIHENFPFKRFTDLNRTKPFADVFKPTNDTKTGITSAKKTTHIFEIESPFLQENKQVCLTGSAKKMNSFDDSNPLVFKKTDNGKSNITLDLSDEQFPIEFKIGIYDTDKNTIVAYEPGVNHHIDGFEDNDIITIIHLNHAFTNYAWKAAGINVPVFSLRTDKGWGVGDFTDINLLVDYTAAIGFKTTTH